MEQKTRRGPTVRASGGIYDLPKDKELTLAEFIQAVSETSPVMLALISGVTAGKWRGWINNIRQNKITMDKQIEVAQLLGAEVTPTRVTFNL